MKRLLLFGFVVVLITSVVVSCQKELSYETDQNLGHGTLFDTAKACQPIISNGTYYNGVSASRDTNYVKVIVTVTQTGSYTLKTDSLNGFGFRYSGYFTKLGVDTILLPAFGKPIVNTATDFTIRLDSSVCGFTIIVQDSTGTGLGGVDTSVIVGDSSFIDPNPAATNTWHFTDSTSGVTYSGIFNITTTQPTEGPWQGSFFQNDTLYIVGQASTTDSVFQTALVIPSLTINPGIYPVTAGNNIDLGIYSTRTPIYVSNDVSAAQATGVGDSYITITSYSNNQLAGSFHVYAFNSNGSVVLIAGSFNTFVR